MNTLLTILKVTLTLTLAILQVIWDLIVTLFDMIEFEDEEPVDSIDDNYNIKTGEFDSVRQPDGIYTGDKFPHSKK